MSQRASVIFLFLCALVHGRAEAQRAVPLRSHAPVREIGELRSSFSLAVAQFVEHPAKPLLFASLPVEGAVAVFLTDPPRLLNTIPIGPAPYGMAVSPGGTKLYVATSGRNAIAVLDLATLGVDEDLSLPARPYDVEAGLDGRVYATPLQQSIGIMQVDAVSGTYLGAFDGSGQVFVYAAGLIDISPDRHTLWFVNRGLSPGTLAQFDVSTSTPALLWRNDHGALGSNGQDLALSPDGSLVSYACGGGNYSYDIFAMRTGDHSVQATFDTGPYPREVTYGPTGKDAFAVHESGHIDVFSTQTGAHWASIATAGEARELAVPRSGRYVFAAFDARVEVYSLGAGNTVVF